MNIIDKMNFIGITFILFWFKMSAGKGDIYILPNGRSRTNLTINLTQMKTLLILKFIFYLHHDKISPHVSACQLPFARVNDHLFIQNDHLYLGTINTNIYILIGQSIYGLP